MHYVSKFESLISGTATKTIIDLGNHGYADSFFLQQDHLKAEESVPLICQLDEYTGLVQTLNFTDPSERYGRVDYSYTSSNSQTSKDHWNEYLVYLSQLKKLENSNVLEIGSNDGFLLGLLKSQKCQVLGIDASKFMSDYATSLGIQTLFGVFGDSNGLLDEITSYANKFQIIVANNVLNHSNNPLSFVKSVKRLLSPEGVFVFEVPYWLETIKSLRFDQIYHEHVTYFTVKAVKELLRTSGLEIIDVTVVNYHGGSIRVAATHESNRNIGLVEDFIINETLEGLFTPARYETYFTDLLKQRETFMSKVNSLKDLNKTIFGIGASAKSNTLLTFYDLNQEIIDFIVDASKFKQGKITPVTKIPIFDDSRISGLSNSIGIVLVWNIQKEVKDNILNINSEVEFINI